MANPFAWGVETLQKIGTKAAGKGKMVWKTLGSEASEEVAEQVGKETGEKLAKIDAKQAARRNRKKAYRKGVNEARKPNSNTSRSTIENHASSSASNPQKNNIPPVSNSSSQVEGQMQMNFDDSGNLLSYTEAQAIAQETAESGPGFWDGIPGWAKTAGIATAGVIAGSVIFGDDDDEY